ncbi:thermonuclease family protein [Amorphus orientalis]|uniref:Endonuclease YncB(Thermonuclease family) n=1 Tax=Amorphus orientalis TaxID=649198 RepID=A0AAE3VQM3_9HYPH|nr:thermonuclease family protein [Amorphus orientalis]MDQ0316381.1 endonuclease YncB(thermonuclease family) [Amorphus orientalis]
MKTAIVAGAVLLTATGALADHATVIDGDTIRIHGETYDLYGIDAPEQGRTCKTPKGGTWPCGEAATLTLQSIVAGLEVACEELDIEADARAPEKVAKCKAAGQDISQDMVRSGFAWADLRYSDAYVKDEWIARLRRKGIWRVPTLPPWDDGSYRREHQASSGPDDP